MDKLLTVVGFLLKIGELDYVVVEQTAATIL